MATSKKEAPVDEEVVVARSVTKKDILEAHNVGKNFYQIAQEFFGSEGDDAVEKVRSIVEG